MSGKDRLERYKQEAKALAADERAAMNPSRGVKLVVSLVVAALVAAFLFPIAIDELANTDTSNWSSGATALWGILGVIVVLALFMYFIGTALGATDQI